jgi:hypothetical protein
VVAVDLASEGDSAGWWHYADTVVQAVDGRSDLAVVGTPHGSENAAAAWKNTRLGRLAAHRRPLRRAGPEDRDLV